MRTTCLSTSSDAASGHLPDDEAVAVHVGHDVGLEVVLVEALVQDLGGHVAPRPHPRAQRDVHLVGIATATQRTRHHTLDHLTENANDDGGAKSMLIEMLML